MFDHELHQKNQAVDRLAQVEFDRMFDVFPEGEQGVAKIDRFTVEPMDMLASISKSGEAFVPAGRYARLKINSQLLMTDSPMEKRTNLEVVEKAHGRVLIAGLGLGMILRTILRKPEVTHITVLERNPEVIDLVLTSLAAEKRFLVIGIMENGHRHLAGTRLEIIAADVFQWEPPTSTPKYQTIYFDIWSNSTVANLPEMHLLHRRYRPLVAKGGWMGSSNHKLLVRKQRDNKRFTRSLPSQLERHWNQQSREEFIVWLRRLLVATDVDDRMLNEQEKEIIGQFAATKGIAL